MDNNTTTRQVADRVAAAIARSGESKSSVAQKALIPRTTLHRKINGAGDFSATELVSIGAALGINPAEFLPAFTRGTAA